MGIFNKNSKKKSRSTTTTLIAKGCTISGKLKLESDIQVDGVVDGQVHVEGSLVVAESGRIKGDIFSKHIIINGTVEGICHSEHIQILSNGLIKGKVFSNNLSIEPGGKFYGEVAELKNQEVVERNSQDSSSTISSLKEEKKTKVSIESKRTNSV